MGLDDVGGDPPLFDVGGNTKFRLLRGDGAEAEIGAFFKGTKT